jgi:hypothetical protein
MERRHLFVVCLIVINVSVICIANKQAYQARMQDQGGICRIAIYVYWLYHVDHAAKLDGGLIMPIILALLYETTISPCTSPLFSF